MDRLSPSTRRPWERTNHAGEPVTLLEGPAWVAGAVAGTCVAQVARALAGDPARSRSCTLAPVLVATAVGGLGALDDLAGTTESKGLKGHLTALRRGEVTTGAVKVVGLAVVGLVGAALVDGAEAAGARGPRPGPSRLVSTLVGGAVVAGAANAVNLFDLRPGRALKVTVVTALPVLTATPAAAAAGASLGVIEDDLAARSMLGDTGANAAGALVGLAVVQRTGPAGRAIALAGLAALTLASERFSFTAVIERHPLLRRLDAWGRPPR